MSMRETYNLRFEKINIPNWGDTYSCAALSPTINGAVDLATLLDIIGDREPEELLAEVQAAISGSYHEEYYSPDGAHGKQGVQFTPPNAKINQSYVMSLIDLKTLLNEWIAFLST